MGAEKRYWVGLCGRASASVPLASCPIPFHGSLGLLGLPVMEGCGLGAAGLGRALGHHRCSFLSTVTPSDCYVTLWLPTASSHRLQTRTVKNSSNPIWNQSFHFRIHSQLKVGQAPDPARCPCPPTTTIPPAFIPRPCPAPSSSPLALFPFQNIVQLQVFDQDFLTSDDPMLSVLFDVGTLQAGEFRRESFSLNPQARLRLGCGGPRPWEVGGEVLWRITGYGPLP